MLEQVDKYLSDRQCEAWQATQESFFHVAQRSCRSCLQPYVLLIQLYDLDSIWYLLARLEVSVTMSLSSVMARQDGGAAFDPQNVDLSTADPKDIICFLNQGENEYDGRLGARVSAIFVILIISSAGTFFPVLATRSKKIRIPLYVYLFARYFGTGVIVATAFIQ